LVSEDAASEAAALARRRQVEIREIMLFFVVEWGNKLSCRKGHEIK
jgi:hypothetical protein